MPPDAGARPPSIMPEVGSAGQSQLSERVQVMVCFSCGRPGHGVNRSSRGVVGGGTRWLISGGMAWGSSSTVSSGKRGMVRAGGSASRTIGDQGTTDPGGGERVSGRNRPAWQLPVGHEKGPSWASSMQAFPPLGNHPTEIHEQDNRELSVLARSVLESRIPIVPDSPIGMGGVHRRRSPQCPELGDLGGGCGLPVAIVSLQRN